MATTQLYTFPATASSGSGSNASVGLTSSPVPTSGTLVAGKGPTGLLVPVAVDASGDLLIGASALPTGAATAAKQDTGNTSLASIDTKLTSVSTSALQTAGNASVASIDSKLGSLGQKASAGSAPVVLASDQSAIPVTVASLPLPAGAATSALQTSGNSSLTTIAIEATSIDSKTPVLGQALAAASVPVVLTAAQLTTLTPLTSTSVTLLAGSAIAGKFGIDQTTPGTTNAVQVTGTVPLPTGAATDSTLAAMSAKLPTSLGTRTITGSMAVNIASDQILTARPSTPAPGTITQAGKTVGTTAIRATVSGSTPSSTRVCLVITPDSASTAKFYIGSSTVTSTGSTAGAQIVAGQSFIANGDAGDYFIISDTAGQTVYIMEQG